MTRVDQVRALYDSTLEPRIEALEGVRRELKAYIVKSAILVGVPLAGFVLGENVLPYPLDATASPMLGSKAEAKWIAAEMRRALRQTAR